MGNFLDGVINNAPTVTRITTIGSFFGIILNVLIGVGVSISVVYIVLAGIRFMTSQGDPKATAQAKQALTYSVAALALTTGVVAFKVIILNSIMGAGGELTGSTPGF